MSTADIISIVCSILGVLIALVTVFVTIFIYKSQKKLEETINKRDEDRYLMQVESEARSFIQMYNDNDEIQLLGLCIIADKYNPSFPFSRKIYKDFCCLNNDVKKEVLKQFNIDMQLWNLESKDFYNNSLKKAEVILKEYFPEQPDIFRMHFYDGAKYFERAIEKYKKEIVPNYVIAKYKSSFGEFDFTYSDLIARVIAKDDLEVVLTNGNIIKPNEIKVDELFSIPTKDGDALNGEEIVISYLCCYILKCSAMYYKDNRMIFDCGYYSDYFGFNNKSMEDLFLETLLLINYDKSIDEE